MSLALGPQRWALLTQGGGVAPIVTGVTSRAKISGAYDLSTVGFDAKIWSYSILDFDLTTDGSELEGLYNNWGLPGFNAPETGIQAITVQALVEYPIGSGTTYLIQWAGSNSLVLAASNQGTWWDKLAFSFTKNTKARIYTLITFASGGAYVPTYRLLSGELCYRGASGDALPILGQQPTAGASTPLGAYGPVGLRAKQSGNNAPLIFVEGDSNTVDQTGSSIDLFGNRTYTKVFSGVQSAQTSCFTGRNISAAANINPAKRLKVSQDQGGKDISVFLGINDITDASVLSTITGYYDTHAANCKAAGLTPHYATLSPKQSLTAPGLAVYVGVNQYIRSQSGQGNFGIYFELADLVSTGRDTNLFKTGYHVGDGLHIDWSKLSVQQAILNPYRTFMQGLGYQTNAAQ